MSPSFPQYLIIAGVAMVAVTAIIPAVKRFAHLVGAVKRPGDRHIHSTPTPEIGGVGILFGVVAGVAAATQLVEFDPLFGSTSEPEAVLLAAGVIALIGFIDDTRGLSPAAKLVGQVGAAATLVLFGVTINYVFVPFSWGGVISLSPDFAAVVTIVAVVAMINAVNLIDGLDGLAAGITLIAAAGLFSYIEYADSPDLLQVSTLTAAPLILATVIGACIGFLIYNFNPASIFMGDTGAMLLGLLLASSGVLAIGDSYEPTRTDFFVAGVPVLIPVLILGLPFLDIAMAVVRRLRSGQGIATADKKHLHHRLLEVGHSQREAVLVLYIWSAIIAMAVVGPSVLSPLVAVPIAAVAALGMALYQVWNVQRVKREASVVKNTANIIEHPRRRSK